MVIGPKTHAAYNRNKLVVDFSEGLQLMCKPTYPRKGYRISKCQKILIVSDKTGGNKWSHYYCG
jgi:hypothetical protein